MEQSEARTWRSLVPEGLQDFWNRVSSGPQQCRQQGCNGTKTDKSKDKKNDGMGKEMGLIYGGSLILNTIIGPGIFTSPKAVLDGAGSVGMSLVIWAICGVFSTMAALCFAELRESVRKDGVEYAYITEAFGPLAGFVYCWMRIAAAEPVGTAVFAVALADYTADSIYDDCGPPGMLRKSIAVLAVVSLALLNVFSQKLADRMQILATVGKTCAIAVIIFYGMRNIFQGKTEEIHHGFDDTVTSPTRITFAFYNGLWAYGGWSNVNHVTSGLKKPPRNLPRLVKFVIPLVMLIYGLVVTSYFTVMSREEMLSSEAIGVTWAERVFGDEAMAVIPIGVGLTALGSLNGTFLSAGRLSGVASKDKQMPEVTSWVHVRSKTPILTVYTRLTISIIMILVADISQLVRFFIFCVWSFHGMSILALLVLRFKNKDKRRPYKVNLVLPVIVVVVIAFLLIGPFLEEPKPEFISALVLIVLSLLFYVPSHWIQDRADLPDKFIIWLQLFFRIAPKREMRRKSILRRMSSFALGRNSIALGRNSILIPAGASPATIRRIQGSPSLLRRVSRVSHMSRLDGAGSPGQYRRNVSSPTIIRRIQRHRSLAEADLKRGRSGSRVAWLETGEGGSPALIRRRPSRQSQSFGAADGRMPKLVSMPNLQVLLNNELDKDSNTDTNTYSNVSSSNNKTSGPNTTTTSSSAATSSPKRSPVISTLNLPPGIRRGSLPVYAGGASRGFLGSLGISHLNNTRRNSSSQSLPNNTKHFLPSPILEESLSNETPPMSDISRQVSESDLAVLGGFESEGGGEYEILSLPKVPLAELNLDRSRSDSDSSSSSSSDDEDFRGLGSLFDSDTESSSSGTTSMDEDGSPSDRERGYNTSDELESDMDEIVFASMDDRAISFV
ncbi:hypothetical protein V1264_000883 [Littorina saxatilis]|uniref:B(0,+)-type amino acid transporter 1 n=1 Tax=Littorina saxatilis TaxID=31220 RepID=A0AAN9GN82_9CAEN